MRNLLVIFLLVLATPAQAFNCDFFYPQFKNSEVRIKYQVTDYQMEDTVVFVESCDDNMLIGLTNAGKIYLPVSSVIEVMQQPMHQIGVYNHYDNY